MIEAYRKKHPGKAAARKARKPFTAGNENEPTKKPTAISQLKKQAALNEGAAPSNGVAAADPSAAKQKAAKAAAQINAPARKRSLKVKEPPASGSARSAKPRSKKAPAAPKTAPETITPSESDFAAVAAPPPAAAVAPEPAAATPTAQPASKPTTEAAVPTQEQKEREKMEKQLFKQTFSKFLTPPEAGTPKVTAPVAATAQPTVDSTTPILKKSNESNFSLWWKKMWE